MEKAAGRLKDSNKNQKVLIVPQKDMPKAVEAMKKVGIKGSVKNMSGTGYDANISEQIEKISKDVDKYYLSMLDTSELLYIWAHR